MGPACTASSILTYWANGAEYLTQHLFELDGCLTTGHLQLSVDKTEIILTGWEKEPKDLATGIFDPVIAGCMPAACNYSVPWGALLYPQLLLDDHMVTESTKFSSISNKQGEYDYFLQIKT